MAITDEQLETLQADIEGTCKSLAQVIEENGLDIDDDELQDHLLNGSAAIELCAGCGWWHQVSELEFIEELGGGYCASCADDEGYGDQ